MKLLSKIIFITKAFLMALFDTVIYLISAPAILALGMFGILRWKEVWEAFRDFALIIYYTFVKKI